jgi:hypothetical protein
MRCSETFVTNSFPATSQDIEDVKLKYVFLLNKLNQNVRTCKSFNIKHQIMQRYGGVEEWPYLL